MSKTITIPDDVYARLEEQAAARGVGILDFIEQLDRELSNARMASAIESMRAEGVLLTPTGQAPAEASTFEPVPIRGDPLSKTIVDERR